MSAFGWREFGLAFGMLVTGSVNTISTTWADNQQVYGIWQGKPTTIWAAFAGEDGCSSKPAFDHPFFQAGCMFLGESLCLIAHHVEKYRERQRARNGDGLTLGMPDNSKVVEKPQNWSPFIFLLPACCDLCGTSIMYAGLCLSYPSYFQMLRGSVVIFTGILSVLFLKRKLYAFHWLGIFLVAMGVLIVGVSSFVASADSDDDDDSKDQGTVMLGNILIVCAQFIVAVQMCVEESFVGPKNIPAKQAVGLEGVFGLSILSVAMIAMYYIKIPHTVDHSSTDDDHPNLRPPYPCTDDAADDGPFPIENAPDAWHQMFGPDFASHIVLIAMVGNILSIAFFNFFGISVTKAMSASHRMVLDSIRTVVVWVCSLAAGWESWDSNSTYIQIIGFIVLLTGTLVYNEVAVVPCVPPPTAEQRRADEEAARARAEAAKLGNDSTAADRLLQEPMDYENAQSSVNGV